MLFRSRVMVLNLISKQDNFLSGSKLMGMKFMRTYIVVVMDLVILILVNVQANDCASTFFQP